MTTKFDHEAAQDYEITFAERWLRENGANIWQAIDALDPNERRTSPGNLREFFDDDQTMWQAFAKGAAGKATMDIGTGPVPAPVLWPWFGEKYAIDPLSSEYDRLCKWIFGRSWFEGIDARNAEAETLQPDLVDKIDGLIFCRNCLDHCREPYIILANISAYAAPGCALMLWSDIYHLDGHDHGHTDITTDRPGFRRVIEAMGFEILREVPLVEDRGTIQFGCFAIKR